MTNIQKHASSTHNYSNLYRTKNGARARSAMYVRCENRSITFRNSYNLMNMCGSGTTF